MSPDHLVMSGVWARDYRNLRTEAAVAATGCWCSRILTIRSTANNEKAGSGLGLTMIEATKVHVHALKFDIAAGYSY